MARVARVDRVCSVRDCVADKWEQQRTMVTATLLFANGGARMCAHALQDVTVGIVSKCWIRIDGRVVRPPDRQHPTAGVVQHPNSSSDGVDTVAVERGR